MRFKGWIPVGSIILLLCVQGGESTLILGSMLMAATAAMTGGLIMGPLTVGGLIMLMMMAANQQQATQRTQTNSASTNIATTLENSQNLLNLLATLTGAAGNLATSASTQSNAFATTTSTSPKASKRALYNPQNLEELLAASSRRTAHAQRRQWKSINHQRIRSTTTPTPRPRSHPVYDADRNDFWNSKPNYFSPDSGYAVEPIPDDLLDIAMRLPQAKSANMFGDFDSFDLTSTAAPSSPSTTADNMDVSSSTPFSSFLMSDLSPPKPIGSAEQLRWVASEPGDLFSSFPQVTEEDLMNFVRKRATREALETKFRLEDIANVTYAKDDDPMIKEELSEREKQEIVNSRILRQLSALDPFRCLPQLACSLQATPPSQQSGLMNDYAYLLKTVFERDDDEDDEAEDSKPASSGVKKNANKGPVASVLSEISALIDPVAFDPLSASSKDASRNKNKKVLDYKSPSKSSSKSKGKKDKDENDKPEDDKNDTEEDEFSSEEVPMDDEALERLMLKEQYEMEQLANSELLDENADPDILPFVLKSASKGPPYLGPDNRQYDSADRPSALAVIDGDGSPGSVPSPNYGAGRLPNIGRDSIGRGPGGMYAQPPPLFNPSRLKRYKTEELDQMSSAELNKLLQQVTYPGENLRVDDGTFGDDKGNIGEIISGFLPKLPEVSFGFSARRKTTGNSAFDDDPFFDDFKKRSLEPFAMQKLKKVRRVVRKVKLEGLQEVRRVKRQITSESDPAEIFRIAKEAGSKFKSPRQCRFLFSSCPMNSTQLLGMIGNIRNAVINLSNAQQLLTGQAKATTTAAPAKDFEQTLATLGPNVVKIATPASPPQTTPAPPPPPPQPQHQHHPAFGMHLQPVLPLSPMMPHHGQSSNQNTLVVPQIIQVPMPIHTQQTSQAAPQPIIVQQPSPQMIQIQPQQQQRDPQGQQQQSHPVFNFGSSSGSGSNGDGTTSISHELPNGEKLEISMKLSGQPQSQSNIGSIKTKKKTAYPSESARPSKPQSPVIVVSPSRRTTSKPKNAAADLVDLFDDDNVDNFLLPTKTLIETEIREPSTSIDSLQAAIMAIEKINQAANEKKKMTAGEDDEKENFPINPALISSLQKPIVAKPITRKPVPSGLRLPIPKKDKNKYSSKTKEKQQDDEGDDESSSEEEDDEIYDADGYKRRLPDPMDPHRRNFLPVPTKSAQFSSTLSVPATQTFVKKRLQIDIPESESPRDSSEETESDKERERLLKKRDGDMGQTSSSEEDDNDEPSHNRRQFSASTTSRYRVRARKPKILYPQEDLEEKPVFIPL